MSVTDLSRVPACELVNELVGRGGVTVQTLFPYDGYNLRTYRKGRVMGITKDMGPTQIVVIPAYGGAV